MILNSCSPHLNELTTYAGTLDDSLSEAQQTAIDQQERSSKISMLVIIVVMVIATAVVLMMATKLIRSIVEPTAQVHKALMASARASLTSRWSLRAKMNWVICVRHCGPVSRFWAV